MSPSAAAGPIYINGRFLGRPITGVERFAEMILREIDENAADVSSYEVLVPAGVARPAFLRNIGWRETGSRQGHLWEQTDLWRASRTGTLVNLCNSAPVMHRRQLTVIHDALVYRLPDAFSPAYGLLHRSLGRLLARRSHLATVSNFSRTELSAALNVPVRDIAVVHNAVGLAEDIKADVSVLDRFSLQGKPFFLFVGSPAPNKNLPRAIEAFRKLARDDLSLVLVGKAAKSFAEGGAEALPANVVATGRLTDEEVQALYETALALIFPSIYEGFGIPPLEAMHAGCPVMAADIPPVREVCADAALYFDPLDVSAITAAMRLMAGPEIDRDAMRARGKARLSAFSWTRSARKIMQLAEAIRAGAPLAADDPADPSS